MASTLKTREILYKNKHIHTCMSNERGGKFFEYILKKK